MQVLLAYVKLLMQVLLALTLKYFNSMAHPIPTPSSPARLITIPVSHYCEKTRWALTRAQIPFVEERHMPPFHRFATRQIGKRSSSDPMPETERNMSLLNQFVIRYVGGQTVPVLITETVMLKSSDEILDYVDAISPDELKLYPIDPDERKQVDELVNIFDTILAPAVRLWDYSYIMNETHLLQPLWCEGVPWFERWLFPVVFPWMRATVFQMYRINDDSILAAHKSIEQIFEMVGDLLADGRSYLVGDRFSAADLAFATLAAAVVIPPGYGVKLPEVSQLPDRMANGIQQFQEMLAGKFVFRLYQEHEHKIKSKI
jgi:glutathione S-transferase